MPRVQRTAAFLVAAVWLTHGLYNKLLGGSPRHLAIVQSVPGLSGPYGEHVLVLVGLVEIAFAAWVLTFRAPRVCAAAQTAALLSMNLTELAFARHLLLWPEGLIPVNLAFLGLAWVAAGFPPVPPDLRRPAQVLRSRARRHPMPIEAHLDRCLALTYALPAAALRHLIPPGLELDTWHGHGFVAVALVQTRSLRPAGLPACLGGDFFLAGYRVFTRFQRPDGRWLRGLRILRSDADRSAMVTGGNLLTHYHYHRCDAALHSPGAHVLNVSVRSDDGNGDLRLAAHLAEHVLPDGSPFADLRQARRFAGPMPFTFDYEPETHSIVVVGSRRTAWEPVPVRVAVERVGFFDRPEFAHVTPVLAAAFHVRNVDYRWERGIAYPIPSSRAGGAQ